MPSVLNDIMERASAALGRMDYLSCEALCLIALAAARNADDWSYYARILLPLQESRRQRRMIAADGLIRLGTTDLEPPASAWLPRLAPGCMVVTHPHRPADASSLANNARQRRHCVEVLFADNPARASTWTLRSFNGPAVSCKLAAPPPQWLDRWLDPASARPPPPSMPTDPKQGTTPTDWFLDACEALGDAALAGVDAQSGHRARIEALETMLGVVTDHEILHQRLGDAARAMCATS